MTRATRFDLPAATLLAAILVAAPAAHAVGTPPPRPTPATPGADAEPASLPAPAPDSAKAAAKATAKAKEARAAAEKRYQEAWGFSEDAKKDLAAGRPEPARKKFGKARKLFERATELDTLYYEAWNMLGFCARQCGDLKAAFQAYGTCLRIAPDYEEAHEYLGEAYLKAGEIEKAKAELSWLRSKGSEEADVLAGKIARVEAGGADAWKSADEWKARPAESAPDSGGTKGK